MPTPRALNELTFAGSRTGEGRCLTLLVILLVAPFVLCTVAPAQGQGFAAQLNPTGDPIGGGAGYRDILRPQDADFTVSNKNGLLSALAQARNGDVIYVADAAVIDLTGEHNLVIPGGVTLASGRGRDGTEGALIFSNSTYPPDDLIPVFQTGGDGVRITGLRFRGPSAEIGDHEYERTGVGNLLRVMDGHDNVEVDNCEIWAWDKWALWLMYSNGAHIHHNYIHHNQRSGYGYGVWAGGAGGEEGSEALIEANLFDYGRHFIASSAHPNSWEARHNIFGPHHVSHNLDRHPGSPAGLDVDVHHNWFLGDDSKDLAVGSEPGGQVTYHHNWTTRATLEDAVEFRAPGGLSNPHFTAYDNTFGGVSPALLPRAVVVATATSGNAPLTVTFDGSGSRAADGSPVREYRWSFGDGKDAVGARAYGAQATYTFTKPGLYQVELMAIDESGLIGTTLFPVLVRPSQPGYVLSAWVLDSYSGARSGFYKKQILIDDLVVWEDDVAGDEGWDHVVVNVASAVSGKDEVRLAFRLLAETAVTNPSTQIIELTMYVDDVYLFGGRVRDTGMEEQGVWRTGTGRMGGGTSSGWGHTYFAVGRSGLQSIETGRNYNSTSEAGTWSEWYQPGVEIEALAPGSQVIALEPGWNVVSLSTEPPDLAMEAVFSTVLSEITFVEDDQGRRFVPGGMNEIGSWDMREAYRVYAEDAATMFIEGTPVAPELMAIELDAGWNLVPFFGSSTTPVALAFSSIEDDLLMAKDHTGQTYFPDLEIQGLGVLRPGWGYQVYMRRPGTLLYR